MNLEQRMLFVAPWNTGVWRYFIDGITLNRDPKVKNFCRATQQWTKTSAAVQVQRAPARV